MFLLGSDFQNAGVISSSLVLPRARMPSGILADLGLTTTMGPALWEKG